MGYLLYFDYSFVLYINKLATSLFLKFSWLPYFLDLYFPLLMFVVITVAFTFRTKLKAKDLIVFGYSCALCAAMVVITTYLMKIGFHRERPPFDLRSIVPLVDYGGYSFVSNHTALFSCLATLVFCYDEALGYSAYMIAFLIGFSRIMLGVHFLTDVFAGYLIGGLIGVLIYLIYSSQYTTRNS